jgi:hypothetical protein
VGTGEGGGGVEGVQGPVEEKEGQEQGQVHQTQHRSHLLCLQVLYNKSLLWAANSITYIRNVPL